MHRKINAMLTCEDYLLIDPFMEEPWKFPRIPRSVFPKKPDPNFVEKKTEFKKAWAVKRLQTMTTAGRRAALNNNCPCSIIYPVQLTEYIRLTLTSKCSPALQAANNIAAESAAYAMRPRK
jgi:hypothetical protein